MEVEGSDSIEQANFVQILVNRQWHNLRTAFDDRRAETELIHHWNSECGHYGTGVLSEALLAWNERIAVVSVFHLPLLHVRSKSDVMMWPEQQTCPFTFQPLANGRDFLPGSFLL